MFSRRFKREIFSCLFLAFCTVPFNATLAGENIRVTGIEGSFDKGSYVIIQGEDFGQKIPAQPFLWDDFEGGTVGASIGKPVIGNYTRTDNSHYSAASPYSGSLCSYSLVDETTLNGVAGLVSDWIPAEVDNAFASMKLKLVSSTGSLVVHGGKLFRLNTSYPDPTHGYPNFCLSLVRMSTEVESAINLGLGWGEDNRTILVGSIVGPEWNNQWTSMAIWDHIGDVDTPNGFAGREWNGSVFEKKDIITLSSEGGTPMGLRSAYFCGYLERQEYDIAAFIDDVYADTTFARVVVSDPVGGNLEMQIPYSWSSSSIQVKVNPGHYSAGTDLSLVVYDSENNASPPFTVTVGENSDGDQDLGAPGPPGQPQLQ